MFLRLSEPILLTEEGLDGLCTSLNRPVVDVEDLPVGPARAAIVVHRDGDGQRYLAVALRSVESGAVTLFGFEGELGAAPGQAMDTGLAFAESMGFLFDDDMLSPGDPSGRRRALESWCEMTGEDLPAPSAQRAAPPDAFTARFEDLDDDEDALLPLDDLVDLIDEELDAAPAAPEPRQAEAAPAAPATDRTAVLSKFRRSPDPASAPDPEPEGNPAQLGRIAIVRRRQEEGASPLPLLTRLLARF